jgi:hypothetical protein
MFLVRFIDGMREFHAVVLDYTDRVMSAVENGTEAIGLTEEGLKADYRKGAKAAQVVIDGWRSAERRLEGFIKPHAHRAVDAAFDGMNHFAKSCAMLTLDVLSHAVNTGMTWYEMRQEAKSKEAKPA